MSDPLARAADALELATRERFGLSQQVERLRQEGQTLARQLERCRERYASLEADHVRLEQQLEAAERRSERSERATRDHVART